MSSPLKRSLSASSDASSLCAPPLQVALLCMTGARATVPIDRAFLAAYGLAFKDTESLTIGAFKQALYDEWTAHLRHETAAKPLSSDKPSVGTDNNNNIKNNYSDNDQLLLPAGGTPLQQQQSEKFLEDVLTAGTAQPPQTHATAHDDAGSTHSPAAVSPVVSEQDAQQPLPLAPPPTTAPAYSTEWAALLAAEISPPPSSPSHIRLIYFGKVLDDAATFEECKFVASSHPPGVDLDTPSPGARRPSAATTGTGSAQPTTFIVHLSIRPPSETKKSAGKSGRRNKHREQGASAGTTGTAGAAAAAAGRAGTADGGDGADEHGSGRCCVVS